MIVVCLHADQAENRSFKPVFTVFCLESDRAAQKIRGAAQKIRGAARRFFPPSILIFESRAFFYLKIVILVELVNDRRVFIH